MWGSREQKRKQKRIGRTEKNRLRLKRIRKKENIQNRENRKKNKQKHNQIRRQNRREEKKHSLNSTLKKEIKD